MYKNKCIREFGKCHGDVGVSGWGDRWESMGDEMIS